VQRIRNGHRRRRGLPVNAEINITNLVDVAFVLLIIFMITAPILQGGIELALPDVQAAPLTSGEGVIVSISSNGTLYIDQVEVSRDEFPAQYRAYVGERDAKAVFLRGDREVPYGRVMEVIGIMEEIGIAEVSLITEPQPRPQGRRGS
jgi:biopolymer transport protein TolR